MTILFATLAAACLVLLILALLQNRKLELAVASANQEAERQRQHYEAEAEAATARVYNEAQAGVAEAQKLIDQQIVALKEESERVRLHYEAEARKVREAADALVARNLAEAQSLRKYERLRDAEAEIQRQLSEAIAESTALKGQAEAVMAQAREAAARERSGAVQKAKALREQAEALLNQATRDAGRIMAEAEKRAEQIGGDAYRALREKELLEQAAEAMRNVVDGYGDRYLVPTHSLLDDLAAEFGYAAAGESLKSARDLSGRMVRQGEAATCDYVETARRTTAIQFVIHAFNGRVDAVLSRVKHDNYGTLEQEIRDACSLVNKDGKAFRDARILPAYLDARLAELKWGVVVQDLARRRQEEQRALREEIRDRELARKEREEKERQAAKEEELKRLALEEAERRLARATAEQVAKLTEERDAARQQLAAATEQALQISQQTKVGHVYVLSNIGSFGEGVYKIGETQRETDVRVKELGGASVPFEFDIHAVIETENSRGLENKLQKLFIAKRVNKQNSRKEFFRVSLTEIRQEVEKLREGKDFTGSVNWTEEARATQWKETRDIESSREKLEKWLRSEQAKARRSPEIDAASSFDEA
jgi:hypothetical protein